MYYLELDTAALLSFVVKFAQWPFAVLGTANKVNYDSYYYRFEPVDVITTLKSMGWVKTHGQGQWKERYCAYLVGCITRK